VILPCTCNTIYRVFK